MKSSNFTEQIKSSNFFFVRPCSSQGFKKMVCINLIVLKIELIFESMLLIYLFLFFLSSKARTLAKDYYKNFSDLNSEELKLVRAGKVNFGTIKVALISESIKS
jgi:hypothetical protein